MKPHHTGLTVPILSALAGLAAHAADLEITTPVAAKTNGEKWWNGNGKRIDADLKKMEDNCSFPSPWAAIRLKNGNTLINSAMSNMTREVNPKGETVWEFSVMSDLPAEFMVPCIQSSVRLANGNTILCSVKGTNSPQLIEVTPDKKVVWVLNDRRELGGAAGVQILNEPGIPEKPGDCQR